MLSRKSLKGSQFTLKNAREDPGVVSQDRKSSRTGGRPTSFDCNHIFLQIECLIVSLYSHISPDRVVDSFSLYSHISPDRVVDCLTILTYFSRERV